MTEPRNPTLDTQQIATLKAEQDYYAARAEAQREATFDFLKARREDEASADASRVYSFYDGVHEGSCLRCIATLGFWARQNAPDIAEPFTIELTSGGGSVIDGFALIDTIRDLQSQGYRINTVAKGWVASMGAVLFQTGTERLIGRRAYLLLHESQAQIAGSLTDIEDKAKFTREMQDAILTLLAERSSLTPQEIGERTDRREWYLNANEAIEYGLADALLDEAQYIPGVKLPQTPPSDYGPPDQPDDIPF
jgi:ATP-dependent protease ClpP protease subunit